MTRPAFDSQAAIDAFLERHGARRFETGTSEALLVAALERHGHSVLRVFSARSGLSWTIDGRTVAHETALARANAYRKADGLEPIGVER